MNKIFSLLLTTMFISAYPGMPENIPPEALKKMPPEMMERFMSGMGDDDEFETLADFFADNEIETSEGFLTLHRNVEEDEYFLELTEEDLDREFILSLIHI